MKISSGKIDFTFNAISFLISLLSVLILSYIIYFLFRESIVFLSSTEFSNVISLDGGWNPSSGHYSFSAMLVSSLLLGLFSTLLVFVFVVLISIPMKFYFSESLQKTLHSFLVICNAIPSVVFGFWGISLVVPFMTNFHFLGTNLLSGIIVISVMLLPTSLLLNLRNIDSWSDDIYLSTSSLGLSLVTCVKKIYIPLMLRQMPKVLILAFTRAIGETMAIVMVSGNVVKLPSSLFDSVRVLTSNIALEMAYATGVHRSSLFFSGMLVGVVIIFLLLFFKIGEILYKKHA